MINYFWRKGGASSSQVEGGGCARVGKKSGGRHVPEVAKKTQENKVVQTRGKHLREKVGARGLRGHATELTEKRERKRTGGGKETGIPQGSPFKRGPYSEKHKFRG